MIVNKYLFLVETELEDIRWIISGFKTFSLSQFYHENINRAPSLVLTPFMYTKYKEIWVWLKTNRLPGDKMCFILKWRWRSNKALRACCSIHGWVDQFFITLRLWQEAELTLSSSLFIVSVLLNIYGV